MFLPAAGQGALAVEGRRDDKEMQEIVAPINHLPSWRCVAAERAFLESFGGGCRAPIGILGTIKGKNLNLKAMVLSADGRETSGESIEGAPSMPEEIGRALARKLLDAGAGELLPEEKL
jgi:hydroxymethylbilane synthase